MMDKEENEEEYNDINGENKEDNLIDCYLISVYFFLFFLIVLPY